MTEQNQNDTPWEGHVIHPAQFSLRKQGDEVEEEGEASDDHNEEGPDSDSRLSNEQEALASHTDTKREITVSMSTDLGLSQEDKLMPDELAGIYRELQARGYTENQLQKVAAYLKDLDDQGLSLNQIEERLKARDAGYSFKEIDGKSPGDLIGKTLGNYKIFEFIAQGGMSDVYKAVENGSGKVVPPGVPSGPWKIATCV